MGGLGLVAGDHPVALSGYEPHLPGVIQAADGDRRRTVALGNQDLPGRIGPACPGSKPRERNQGRGQDATVQMGTSTNGTEGEPLGLASREMAAARRSVIRPGGLIRPRLQALDTEQVDPAAIRAHHGEAKLTDHHGLAPLG